MVSPTDTQLITTGQLAYLGNLGKFVTVMITKQELQTILQRALNTWSDAPEKLLEFSDLIDKI